MTPPLTIVELLWLIALTFGFFFVINAVGHRIKVTWKSRRRRVR